MKHLRRWQILILASVLGLALLPGLVSQTEAQWSDSEYVSGAVGSGSWVTSGYGVGVAARVASAGGIAVLPTGPNSLPWVGSRTLRDQTNPGTATTAGSGPFTSNPAVATVNLLTLSGNTLGTAVGASSCGSYVVGVSSPTYCATPNVATASASVNSLRMVGTLVSVAIVRLINSSIVNISASQAISTSVSCNLVAGTNSWVQPSAANVTGPNPLGSVLVGNTAVRIPSANSTTTVASITDGTVGYSNVQLASTASATSSAAGFTKLTLTGSMSLLSLGLLPLTFSIELVSAQCGPGSAPAASAVALPTARGAVQPEAAGVSEAPTSTVAPTTTAGATETEVSSSSATPTETTTPSATETTTEEAAAAPPPEATTTTEPPPVEAAEPPPVETAEPPPTPTTTTPPPTTTEPPDPATVFTGPAEGNVETLTFAGDVVCTAPTGADYTGTVELACDDGSSVAAIGSALTPAGVAASTAGGVWSPVLTAGGTARPVLAATRG